MEEGDIIHIDVEKKYINLEVSEDVLTERRERLLKSSNKQETGWLSIYQRVVRPLNEAAVLID